MNIFNKAALQSLLKNRTRTLVTIIGVALSSALITAVASFGVSLLSYMINGSIAREGNWHVAFLSADSAFVQEQADSDLTASCAAYENIGYAKLDNCKDPEKPYLFIAGYNDDALAAIPLKLFSGRLPENDGEAVISGKLAVDGGVKISCGDTVTLSLGQRMNGGRLLDQSDKFDGQNESFIPVEERSYKIVGICQRPATEGSNAPGYTVITKTDGKSSDSFSLFVTLKDPHRLHDYLTMAARERDYVLNNNVLRFYGLSDDNTVNSLLYIMSGIVIAIIMTGSVFLIYNSFSISLNERTQQFGVLMSVGATAKQLRSSVLFEGLCIGAVGIPAGILLGLGSISLVIAAVAKAFSNILYTDVPLRPVLSVPAIIAAAILSLVTILLSALIPAKKAVGMPIMECIRQTNEIKAEAKALKTPKLVQDICGLEGALAYKNFKRSKTRYRSIVLSLVLSVSLFVSANALVSDVKAVSGDAKEFTDCDIAFTSREMVDSELVPLYEKMRLAAGVYSSSYQETDNYICSARRSDLSDACLQALFGDTAGDALPLPMCFQFLDDSSYYALLSGLGLSAEEYTGSNAKLLTVAMAELGGEYQELFKRQSLTLDICPQTTDPSELSQSISAEFAFVNTVPPDVLPDLSTKEYTPVFLRVMLPYSAKEYFPVPSSAVGMKGMTFSSENSAQTAAAMEAIIEGACVSADHSLYNMDRIMGENRNLIFIANVFSYTFIVMISLIAVANVFNTISTSIKLRRRELAMLRSVGMSERDFQKMMDFECGFFGLRSLLLGLPISFGAAWLIHGLMFTDEVSFSVPWSSMGIAALGVMLIVFVTMLYAVSRIKKENIIDALRDDMS